jgi:G:T-mismatch repair DNA endonuclease (very short patch repair protein)
MARDAKNIAMLAGMGWQVLVICKCELRDTKYKLPNPAAEQISCIINKIDHINSP